MSNTFTLGLAKVWIGWMREVDLPTVAYWTDIHHAFQSFVSLYFCSLTQF